MMEDLDREGFYSRRGWVRTGPGRVQVGEARVQASSTVEARVGVTQAGERLRDGVKLVANLRRADRLTASAGTAVAYTAREYL